MHPVLTLGKLGGDCPIRMRKGCQGGVGRHQGAPTSARVCSKVPTGSSLETPPSPPFLDFTIQLSKTRRTAGQWNSLFSRTSDVIIGEQLELVL